jgi:hypothetical protein
MHLEFESEWFFRPGQHFGDVIASHNAFDLERWRGVFERNRREVARIFVESIGPHAESTKYDERAIRQALRVEWARRARQLRVGLGEAYDPWANYWSGRWAKDPKKHYHVWDVTQPYGGAYIQAVTQSRTAFVTEATIDKMLRDKQADLAINVASRSRGLTGWVSKRQGGKSSELPHLGYLLARGELLWIACILPKTSEWFMYYERVVTSGDARYRIHGVQFSLDEKTGEMKVLSGPEVHNGEYAYHDPLEP